MTTRLLERYLQTLGDRVRFDVEEHEILRVLHLQDLDDESLIYLLYNDRSKLALALAYLAWRALVANGQCNKENYVFFSSLTTTIEEHKARLNDRIDEMAYDLEAPRSLDSSDAPKEASL